MIVAKICKRTHEMQNVTTTKAKPYT